MKYTPPAEPSRNGHTSRLPSDFAQAARLMTRRPLPAKPVASQVPTDIPVPAREDRYLSDAHIAELEASGIPAEYALDSGAYTEDDPEALAKLLNWERVPASRGSGLVLLSHDADGNMASLTVKFDVPRIEVRKSGKKRDVKYENAKDRPINPHIPPGTRAVLNDPTVDLCFTEGWKKAVSLDFHDTPCIALSGVTMWRKDGKLRPELVAIALKGRRVYILYDAEDNDDVRREERELAATLTKRGAVVTVVLLPPGENGEKVALDDYIVAHGMDALRQLMADAHRTQHPTPNTQHPTPNDGEPLGTNPTTQQEPNEGDPSPDIAGVGCWALGGGQAVPFPVGVLPVVLAAFVRAASAALPCPPDYIGVLMLAVLGTLIGRKRCVQVKQGWREFAVFWVLMVGRSGTKKTPADTATTGPLHDRQRALADEYKRELAEWLKRPLQERQDTPKPVLRQVVATSRLQARLRYHESVQPPSQQDQHTIARLKAELDQLAIPAGV